MDLKYPPYGIFKRRANYRALYARTNWLHEKSPDLRERVRSLVDSVYGRQMKDGSWNGSVVKTVENLYVLSLLAPERGDSGARGVEWLLEKEAPPVVRISGDGGPYTGLPFRVRRDDVREIYTRKDLPFNRGCSGFFKSGAALYFSGFFSEPDDRSVNLAFRSLDKVLLVRRGRWCSVPCSNNILRAYLSHPKKRDSAQSKKALKFLEKIQTENGGWRGTPFFYHTFNAIAQSRLPSARRQIERATDRIMRSQNNDGTWGRGNLEFATFMVLDGLHRQGML